MHWRPIPNPYPNAGSPAASGTLRGVRREFTRRKAHGRFRLLCAAFSKKVPPRGSAEGKETRRESDVSARRPRRELRADERARACTPLPASRGVSFAAHARPQPRARAKRVPPSPRPVQSDRQSECRHRTRRQVGDKRLLCSPLSAVPQPSATGRQLERVPENRGPGMSMLANGGEREAGNTKNLSNLCVGLRTV